MNKKILNTLIEVYRRLFYFHNGNINTNLLLLSLPSFAKDAVNEGFVEPVSDLVPRCPNWYRLTEKGKKLFKNFCTDRINDKDNEILAYPEKWWYNEGIKVYENVRNKIVSKLNT